MANKKIVYTDNDRLIVETLKGAEAPMTMAELSEAAGVEFKSGHLTAARTKGLIELGEDREVLKPAVKEVATYQLITEEISVRPSLKEGVPGKPYGYSETELAIMKVLKDADAPMTLAEISEALGTPLTSGSINALVNRKGNVAKVGTVEVPTSKKSIVHTYRFLADIPSAE